MVCGEAMINYELFTFASPPRTGTTWFRKAADAAGLRCSGRNELHVPGGLVGMVRVGLMRNPVDWLKSYWAAIYPGQIGVPAVDYFRGGGDFKSFEDLVRFVVEDPGCIRRMHVAYSPDVCLRIEDMPWAFVRFLESIGVPEKLANRCLTLNPQNTTRREKLPTMPRYLEKRLFETECDLCEAYDYW